MSIWIVLFSIIYLVGIIYSFIIIRKNIKKYNDLKVYWPSHLRVTENKILQYSLNEKDWSDVMGFSDNITYKAKDGKEYIGPGFGPIKVRDDEDFNNLKNILGSIQQIHEWERAAFNHYKEAIYKYLENERIE